MASKYNPRNDIFVCSCGSLEHQFVFQIYDFGDDEWLEQDPEENVMCSLAVFLNEGSFWRRLKKGLAYIFGHKSRYGHFDSADINDRDAARLIEGLTAFRNKVQEYREKVQGRAQCTSSPKVSTDSGTAS